jgi:flagellar hook assembly protein FlgD
LSASPNPVLSRTEFAFSLDAPASVSLGIYDAAGRRVRMLLDDQPADAGRRLEAWDRRDDRGRRVPAGIYFGRLASRTGIESIKLTLRR